MMAAFRRYGTRLLNWANHANSQWFWRNESDESVRFPWVAWFVWKYRRFIPRDKNW